MNLLQNQANFMRLKLLLMDKGTRALRDYVVSLLKDEGLTLYRKLRLNEEKLQRLYDRDVIKVEQWQKLYPSGKLVEIRLPLIDDCTIGLPDIENLDITLLTILLRNIFELPSPATGWSAEPPASDTSISADILRIKIYRNMLDHGSSPKYDDVTFENSWQRISRPLVRLGIPQQEIVDSKVASLSPQEESCKRVLELKMKNDDLKAKLRKLEDIDPLNQLTKWEFTSEIVSFNRKFKEEFQRETRQWIFDNLTEWFYHKPACNVMILIAGSGCGKSVLSAKVYSLYHEKLQVAGWFFCNYKKENHSNPSYVIQSLASQMCDKVCGFREKLKEILGRNHCRKSLLDEFTVLLSEPLHALGKREPMLIVLDALDEIMSDKKREFLELISEEVPKLPCWIKMFITSRPGLQVNELLNHLNPLRISLQDVNQKSHIEFRRFKKCLKHLKPDMDVDHLLKHFDLSNPNDSIKNLFKSMDLSNETGEIREAIGNLISEIYPKCDYRLTS